eukprot:TRINITY_DN15203_c0_g1_i1.p1 TRINITY_DN15203_c0_g1~~TRINITY_DN15203_c0_g1_i1.p1  ORF type:complete len:105 (-),score=18.46 TRINITY_DN15203_c0_g1_i1:121-435(-)
MLVFFLMLIQTIHSQSPPLPCNAFTSPPVKCTTPYGNTGACLELATCNTTNAGSNSPCYTPMCKSPFGNYCCPTGQPQPYFINGVCQCHSPSDEQVFEKRGMME